MSKFLNEGERSQLDMMMSLAEQIIAVGTIDANAVLYNQVSIGVPWQGRRKFS
jgi:hypothetical protein